MWLFLNWVYFHKLFLFSCFSVKFFLNYQPVLTTLQGNREEGVCSHLGRVFIRVRGQAKPASRAELAKAAVQEKGWGLEDSLTPGQVSASGVRCGVCGSDEGVIISPSASESYKEPTLLLKDECTFGYAERRDRGWSEKFLIKEEFLGFQLTIY